MEQWKREMVETSRGDFEVFMKGEGKPICVTHLYSEFNRSGDLFADSFTKDNKVYLVNLREAGDSEKAHEAYQFSMLESVLDLEAIRDALGYDVWTFAGHSTGGMLALVYGIYFSQSLEALVIVCAAARDYTTSEACIYHPNHNQFQKMQNLIETLKDQKLTSDERKKVTEERTKLSLHQPDNYPLYFPPQIRKKMATSRMNFFARELPLYDVTKKLTMIKTKTLIICGKHDVQCPLTFSVEMNEHIKNAQLIICEQSNHYPFLEEKEFFLKEVKKFLS